MIAQGQGLGVSAPGELLRMARQLLDRASPETAGLWPRAAALLARQALEMAVDEFWAKRRIPLESCPTRQQLICLRDYMGDASLAGRVHHAWNALSSACHHHPYELAPTAGELGGWIGVVEAFARPSPGEPSSAVTIRES